MENGQAHPFGGHQKYRRAAAEKEARFPDLILSLRDRGGTCGKCAESTEEGDADRVYFSDPFVSGFFLYDVLFCDHEDQPEGDLF